MKDEIELKDKWKEIIEVCNKNQDAIASFEIFEGYIKQKQQEALAKIEDIECGLEISHNFFTCPMKKRIKELK